MTVEFPTLATETLLLRQFVHEDLGNVFKGLSHPDVIKYYGISFSTREAATEQMEWFAALEENGTGIWWAVCSRNNHTFYGAGGLNNVNKQHGKAEVGFWLLPEFWGMGIMTAAMPLICDHGFNQLGLHRIEGFVETGNTICKKAMSKLDFVHEGTMKDCEVKYGRYISLDIYAKLNPVHHFSIA